MRHVLPLTVEGKLGLTSGYIWWMNEEEVLLWCTEELTVGNWVEVRLDLMTGVQLIDCRVAIQAPLPPAITRVSRGYVYLGRYRLKKPEEQPLLVTGLFKANPDLKIHGPDYMPPRLLEAWNAVLPARKAERRGSSGSHMQVGGGRRLPVGSPRDRLRQKAGLLARRAMDRVANGGEASRGTGPEFPAAGQGRTTTGERPPAVKEDAERVASGGPPPGHLKRRGTASGVRAADEGGGQGPAKAAGSAAADAGETESSSSERLRVAVDQLRKASRAIRGTREHERVRSPSSGEQQVVGSGEDPAGRHGSSGDQPAVAPDEPPAAPQQPAELRPPVQAPDAGAGEDARPPISASTRRLMPAMLGPGSPPTVLLRIADPAQLRRTAELSPSRLQLCLRPLPSLSPGERVIVLLTLPDATFLELEGVVIPEEPSMTCVVVEPLPPEGYDLLTRLVS